MRSKKPLINAEYLLQKFPGKGGWTYAAIPEVSQNKNTPFGWVKVKGSIDDFLFNQYKLMPMGNGKLFLPVKKTIQKKIHKKAGDYVKIILDIDDSLLVIPKEILACFKNEPKDRYKIFSNFTEGQKKAYIDWIYNAKTEKTKASRIIKMMDRLAKNLTFHDNEIE